MPSIVRASSSALLLALTVAACGDGPTRPDDRSAAGNADAVLGSITQAGVAGPLSTDGAAAAAALTTAGCSYAAGRYECAPVTRAGITITRSFAFYDAAGAPQQRYDALTTASVLNNVTLRGTAEHGASVAEIERSFTQTASGLFGTETRVVVDGTGSGRTKVTTTVQGKTHTMVTTSYDTTRALVLPVAPTAGSPAYPLGGSVTMVVQYAPEATSLPVPLSATTMRVTTTYDGTSVARVDLSFGALSQSCTYDMALRPPRLACPNIDPGLLLP